MGSKIAGPETTAKRPVIAAPTSMPVTSGVLRRQCACGQHTIAGGECKECSKKKRFGLQTKLKVNDPGDIYEREADRIADQVMATPADAAVGAPPPIQRFAGQSTGEMDTAPASVEQALASPGRPLEPPLRQNMEQRFGHDFSRVRVHTDAKAAESAQAVNARAYTVGRDLVFGARQFAPNTEPGRKLLSHELAHVVQQSGKAFESTGVLRLPPSDDAFEQQAEALSADSREGAASLASNPRTPAVLQRAVEEEGAQTVTGTNASENECAGWFADHESTSKRAAEHYVRTELVGDRGTVERIDCNRFIPDTGAFGCTVHFSDGTPIRVIGRRDAIIVSVYPIQTMYPPPDRPLCWYDYKCPGPNRDLVLTKRKCQTSKPAGGAPPPKAHGPEP